MHPRVLNFSTATNGAMAEATGPPDSPALARRGLPISLTSPSSPWAPPIRTPQPAPVLYSCPSEGAKWGWGAALSGSAGSPKEGRGAVARSMATDYKVRSLVLMPKYSCQKA